MLGTYAIELFSTSISLHYVIRTYMTMKLHDDDICISIQFVADFRPHWPRSGQCNDLQLIINGAMLKCLLHPKLYRGSSFFLESCVLHCKVLHRHNLLQTMPISVTWRHQEFITPFERKLPRGGGRALHIVSVSFFILAGSVDWYATWPNLPWPWISD